MMESEVPEINKNESVLSDRDKVLLQEAGMNLFNKFISDYPQELPDGIVLPETSARPLWPLLKEVVGKVAGERHVKEPSIFFFNVNSARILREEDINKPLELVEPKIKTTEDARNELKTAKEEYEKSGNDTAREKYEAAQMELSNFELMDFANSLTRKKQIFPNQAAANFVQAERAQEILKHGKKDDPQFVVFDDFASGQAFTGRSINKAFGTNIPYYAFLANADEDHFASLGLNVKVGVYNENDNNGFDYRQSKLNSYNEYNKVGIGTYKNSNTIEKYPSVDVFDTDARVTVNQLRSEMKSIGQSIASTLYPPSPNSASLQLS